MAKYVLRPQKRRTKKKRGFLVLSICQGAILGIPCEQLGLHGAAFPLQSLLELMLVIPLHRHVVVRDGQHGVLVLRTRMESPGNQRGGFRSLVRLPQTRIKQCSSVEKKKKKRLTPPNKNNNHGGKKTWAGSGACFPVLRRRCPQVFPSSLGTSTLKKKHGPRGMLNTALQMPGTKGWGYKLEVKHSKVVFRARPNVEVVHQTLGITTYLHDTPGHSEAKQEFNADLALVTLDSPTISQAAS